MNQKNIDVINICLDMMDTQKAIDVIISCLDAMGSSGMGSLGNGQSRADIKEAKEAFKGWAEKQIPKKPKGVSITHHGRVGNCPLCGSFMIEQIKVCDCGQKLDWG